MSPFLAKREDIRQLARIALVQPVRMPRTSRSIVGGHVYHLINRSNGGVRIFQETADYAGFLALVREASDRLQVPILAACLMPNHIHFVVRPSENSDLAKWTHWLFTTHVRRYHAKNKTCGRLWQGRFKAFVIQEDDHLLTVLRYVERNALRAGLATRAERWLWGSLRWRQLDTPPIQLERLPTFLPRNWVDYVNQPQTTAELDAIRTCVNRQRPFGATHWVRLKAHELGVEHSLAPPGRRSQRGGR